MKVYLGFHGLGDPPEDISEEERHYWVPLRFFHDILDIAAQFPGQVEFTFDDGNISDIEHGLPALRQRGLSATFFIVSERIDRAGYLSANDILLLQKSGMRIGSHGQHHVRWTKLSDGQLIDQVSSSMTVLSEVLGKPVNVVSMPFGAYDQRVLRCLRRLPVMHAYSSDFGPAVSGAFVVARNSITNDQTLTEIHNLIKKRFTFYDDITARLRLWRRSSRRLR